MKALHDTNASDNDDIESRPEIVSTSTAIRYIASLKELVCRKDMGGDHVAALNRLESIVLSSALQKQPTFFRNKLENCFVPTYGFIFAMFSYYERSDIANESSMTVRFVISGLDRN